MDFEEADMMLIRADAAFILKKYNVAADSYQKYIEMIPVDTSALVNYARTLVMLSLATESKSEKTELNLKAIALCKRCLQINGEGGSYWGHRQLAMSYFEIDEYSEAANSYLAALDFRPNDPVILKELGTSFFYMREFEKSEKYYRQSLGVNPDDGHTWYGLGCALLKTRSRRAAKKAFKRAVDIDPENIKWQTSYKSV